MNYFNELMRIAETCNSAKDKKILMEAAVKLIPQAEPRLDIWKKVEHGYHNIKVM